MKQGHTIWFTGLPSAGKTTIANQVAKRLRELGISVIVLDGDVLRKTLSPGLGYSVKDRHRQLEIVTRVCNLISQNGVLSIVSTISHKKEFREYARSILSNFSEVYIKCPLEVCKKRDVKGLYKKYTIIPGKFVGVTLKYIEPENPEVILETNKETISESTEKLLNYIIQLKQTGKK